MRSSRGAVDLSLVVSLLLLLYPATALLRPPPHNYVAPLLCSSHLSCAHRIPPSHLYCHRHAPVFAASLPSPYHYATPYPCAQMPALQYHYCVRRLTTVHGMFLLYTACFYVIGSLLC